MRHHLTHRATLMMRYAHFISAFIFLSRIKYFFSRDYLYVVLISVSSHFLSKYTFSMSPRIAMNYLLDKNDWTNLLSTAMAFCRRHLVLIVIVMCSRFEHVLTRTSYASMHSNKHMYNNTCILMTASICLVERLWWPKLIARHQSNANSSKTNSRHPTTNGIQIESNQSLWYGAYRIGVCMRRSNV